MAGTTTYRVTTVYIEEGDAEEAVQKAIDAGALEVRMNRVNMPWAYEGEEMPVEPPQFKMEGPVLGLDIIQLLDAVVPGDAPVSGNLKKLKDALGAEVIGTSLSLGQALNIYRERQAKIRREEESN